VAAWIIIMGAIALWSWAAPHSFVAPDLDGRLQERVKLAGEGGLGTVTARQSYGRPMPVMLTEHIRWHRLDEGGSVIAAPIAKDKRFRNERPGVTWLRLDEADPAAATLWRLDVVALVLVALAALMTAAGAVLMASVARGFFRHADPARPSPEST